MGYTTDFDGALKISPTLTDAQVKYLQAFNNSRRMKRSPIRLMVLTPSVFPNPLHTTVGLGIGEDGQYFVDGNGFKGQDKDNSIVEYNSPPSGQPSLWCQWTVSSDGTALEWDDGEKFYEYTRWLEYLIEHFFTPWGRSLDGRIHWYGEDSEDRGTIYVKDNVVEEVPDTITNPGPSWGKATKAIQAF